MVTMKRIENSNVIDKQLIPKEKEMGETLLQFMPSDQFNALTPSSETMDHDATSPQPVYY